MQHFPPNRLAAAAITATLLALPAFAADPTGDPAAGAAKIAVCTACHGQTGVSITPMYPNLAGQGTKYLHKQLRDIQAGTRPVVEMTGMLDGLSDQDLADIAAYYAVQEPVITGSQEVADAAYGLSAAEFLALGERVFRGGNLNTGVAACTGCHSPTGSGNAPAAYPALGGQHADYLIKQLKNFQTNMRTNDGDSRIMRAVAAPMSDLEIRAVANYLAGLHGTPAP
ncbi:MAG: cytochrome c4 [Cellvibrionales bacterium]|nr:cytochrome c4 [Cellvibrionales bacterium]